MHNIPLDLVNLLFGISGLLCSIFIVAKIPTENAKKMSKRMKIIFVIMIVAYGIDLLLTIFHVW